MKSGKRPETATLEKPTLLDPCWLGKLDMTTLTRENVEHIGRLVIDSKKQTERREPCHSCQRAALRERFHTHPQQRTNTAPAQDTTGGKTRTQTHPQRIRRRPSAHPPTDTNPDQITLVKCCGCSRSFHPSRISVHESACLTQRKNIERCSQMENELSSLAYCYVCGKVFEKDSPQLPGHIEECLAKWHEANEALPESLRKPEPIKPDTVLDSVAGNDSSFWQQHLTMLIACFKCGRKFTPDRVKIHEKSCKGLANK